MIRPCAAFSRVTISQWLGSILKELLAFERAPAPDQPKVPGRTHPLRGNIDRPSISVRPTPLPAIARVRGRGRHDSGRNPDTPFSAQVADAADPDSRLGGIVVRHCEQDRPTSATRLVRRARNHATTERRASARRFLRPPTLLRGKMRRLSISSLGTELWPSHRDSDPGRCKDSGRNPIQRVRRRTLGGSHPLSAGSSSVEAAPRLVVHV